MNRSEFEATCDRLAADATDKGQLILVGFYGLMKACMDPSAPPIQVREMRMAFYAGAQHLFASIMGIMDEDREPTAQDLKRMELISNELERFAAEFARDHVPTKGSA